MLLVELIFAHLRCFWREFPSK